MTPIEDAIATYIAENIFFSKDGYSFPVDSSFLDHGIVDSVNILELVLFVEEKYDISVEDDEITPQNFDSVSKLARYVKVKNHQTAYEEVL
jgi:acyl carrier protein